MKKINLFIYYLISFFFLLESLACSSLSKTQKEKKDIYLEDNTIHPQWEECLKLIHGKRSFGKVYKLGTFIPYSEHRNSNKIAGFRVTDTIKGMNSIQRSTLLFALRNPYFYSTDTTTFKTIFAPYIAIELKTKKRNKHYLILSYNNREIAFATDSVVLRRRRYNNQHFFLSFGMNLFPLDNYIKTNYELEKRNKQ